MTETVESPSRDVAILEAACRVVVREGAHGLRMASVAGEAGVSKALVHYYFPTRRDLLRRAFALADERFQEAVVAETEALGTGAERLERALLVSIDAAPPFGDQRALWNEVWSSVRFDDELRPLAEGSYRRWLDRLLSFVQKAVADGSAPATLDALRVARTLAAIADGADSLLYLGLLERDDARALVRDTLRRELRPL